MQKFDEICFKIKNFLQLLATMVTYLVVLLQFQISIPDDTLTFPNATAPNLTRTQ